MKKIITFLILLIFPIIVHAENITTFSLSEVTASPGNNVTVKLNMNNKQEFGVLTGRIRYDKDKLGFISSELNGLKSVLRGSDNNEEKGLVTLYAINLSGSNQMKDNGNILTIEFKIKEDVTEDIPLKIEIKDFGVDENTPLKYETKDGVIKIKKDVATVSKDDKTTLQKEIEEVIKKDEEITWSTTDDEIATVGDDGTVTFKKDGNVTIEAKDKDGNVIYSKDYYVKEKVKKKFPFKIAIAGVIAIIVIALIIIIRSKKCRKRKQS